MNKVFVIARRDYWATVGTKGFVISILMAPILMAAGILIPKLVKDKDETSEKTIVVLDGTNALMPVLQALTEEHNTRDAFDPKTKLQSAPKYKLEVGPSGAVTDDVRLQLSERVKKDEIAAFVEIPADLLTAPPGPPKEVPFHTQKVTAQGDRRWFDRILNRAMFVTRLRNNGVDPAVVGQSMLGARLEAMTLVERDKDGTIKKAEASEREFRIFVPMGIMTLVYISIMMSQYMLQSTMEEKQQRIAEVLLGSVNPFQLMAGKLLANVGISLTVMAIYVLGGALTANYYGVTEKIPFGILGWVVAYQILGVFLFGSIFGAIGSACADMKDAQGLLMPVMIVLMIPMFIWFAVMDDPNSRLSIILSLIPTMAPMLMPFRLALNTQIPVWQPLLGVVLMAALTVFCVFAAGRVFRIGILAQGKTPRFAELLRWAVQG
jgi:ABC-2 type transport system permease protein